jgi:hypothetical protein
LLQAEEDGLVPVVLKDKRSELIEVIVLPRRAFYTQLNERTCPRHLVGVIHGAVCDEFD